MTETSVPRILGSWRQRVDPAVRRALVGMLVFVSVAAAHLARHGSVMARAASAAVLLGAVVLALVVTLVRAHRFRAPQAIVRLMKVVNRSVGLRIGRAQRLVADGKVRPNRASLALAERHLARSLATISTREVERRASLRARRLVFAALAAWVAAVLLVLVEPVRIVEGWNVLLARQGRAPFEMHWVQLEQGRVYPPSYLRQASHALELDRPLEAPKGTVVVVRGEARFADREMFLTDGRQESPFVSDGEGRVTARLTCQKSGVLGVVARWGEVRIWQPAPLALKVLEDEPPRLVLDGGKESLSLKSVPRITLDYRVEDDHGLWEIELRLRSGAAEERRQLTKLDGIRRTEQGVLVLDAKDPFFERAYLPVVVTLLARDSNAIDGPTWSESAAVTVLVPELGDKEVGRVRAIHSLRERLISWLARELEGRLPGGVVPGDPERQEHLRWLEEQRMALAEAGLVPRGFLQLLLARLTKLSRAVDDRERILTLTDVLTFVDSAGETVGERGVESVARSLAEISDQLSAEARRLRLREFGRGELREVEMTTSILASGARQLQNLGRMGRELGGLTEASMGRIARAQLAGQWHVVERASTFLAERLRHPTVAFAVNGTVGVESMRQVGGPLRGRASEADTRFDRLSTELSDIAKAHAIVIEQVTELVSLVDETAIPQEWHDDIRNHAETIRKTAKLLDRDSSPGAALSPLVPLQEASLSITDSLDRMMLVPALEQLESTALALSSLSQNPSEPGTSLDIAPLRLAQSAAGMRLELAWLRSQVDLLRRQGSSQLVERFEAAREREGELAERTEQIVTRESAVDAVLPDEVRTDLDEAARFMRDAARELEATRGPPALVRQRDAQRLLERSYVGGTFDDVASLRMAEEPGSALGPMVPGDRVPITPTFDAMARETFRRKVQEGLGLSSAPDLRDAIERYTEGLLR